MRVEAGVHSHYYLRRQRQARVRRIRRIAAAGCLLLLAAILTAALVYAGSPGTIARGIRVDGVDIGGLTTTEARKVLARHAADVAKVPVTLTANGRTFEIRPAQIGLHVDWTAAVASARSAGDGLGPLRGFRRMKLRLLGEDITAKASYNKAALRARVARIAKAVDRPHREAALEFHGLKPVVVPARDGVVLDRDAASAAIVAALASLRRDSTVVLPLERDVPEVTAPMLARAATRARTAVSAPVSLTLGPTHYRVPRWRIAKMLELPAHGRTKLAIGGKAADAYFERLAGVVNTKPKDAQFAVVSGGITIRPSADGRTLEVPGTAKALLSASLRPTNRVAPIALTLTPPKRTTQDARKMGITGVVSSYTTDYGGIPNRISNVELVSHLIDGALIPPGKEFSFNGTTGERGADKGFKEAPVIINGELQTALGGGVCQVSTTVFNAAFEAGLPITARTNHALYISHYPQGRDATVNYPDTDLKFVNDTDHWLLLRTFVSSSSLTVNLYGTPQHRKVVSETAPLQVTGPTPVDKVSDPTLPKGEQVVEQAGSPPRSTSVTRKVYDADGKLLSENTWYSSYQGEKEIVRVGTKKPEKPKKPAKNEPGGATQAGTPGSGTPAGTSTPTAPSPDTAAPTPGGPAPGEPAPVKLPPS